MDDLTGGPVGSAPVAYNPLGSSYTFRQADGSVSGSSTAIAYITAIGWNGAGLSSGVSIQLAFSSLLFSGQGLSSGSSASSSAGVTARQGTGSSSGSASVSCEGSSLAAAQGLDRSEPFGYGGPLGSTALSEQPIGYSRFDASRSVAYGFSSRLISRAGQAQGSSSASALQGYIGSALGSASASAVVGFIGRSAGSVTVTGYLNVYGAASGTSTAGAIAGHQGLSTNTSAANAVNGSVARMAGSSYGSCTVRAYLLWQEPAAIAGTLWDFDKYTSGVGGPVGSISVGAIPIGATDIEPTGYSAEWQNTSATSASWTSPTAPSSVTWSTPTPSSTTWQKAA